METLWQDLRYAARMLAKSPGFTAAAVVTLALGIGANASFFSVVNGLLLAPLPYQEPEKLIRIYESNRTQGWDQVSVSAVNFADWKQQNQTFEDMFLFTGRSLNLTGQGEPIRLQGMGVSANAFAVLKREPAMGRTFAAGEDAPGAPAVVVLGHAVWERQFGADPHILNKTILLDEVPHTVIGVMPRDFFFVGIGTQLWVPLQLTPAQKAQRGSHSLAAMGRLKKGVELNRARADLDTIAARLEKEYPNSNTGWRVSLLTAHEELFDSEDRLMITILYLSVGFVLLIACANVANLLLSRAAAREREIAVRLAIGAGRVRLVRQLLTESMLLAAVGGIAGLFTTYWGIQGLLAIAPSDIPNLDKITLNRTVLFYALGVSLLTGMIFGLAPAFHGTRASLQDTLKQGGPGSGAGSRHRLLKGLVVAEVALAIILLACGGLMVRSYQGLLTVNPGFNTHDILTMRITLPEKRYPEEAQRASFLQRVMERFSTTPGVVAAGAVQTLPLGGSNSWTDVTPEGRPPAKPGQELNGGLLIVTPDYFRALEIPLMQGRHLTDQDTKGSLPVALINQRMARDFWPGEDSVVGRRFKRGSRAEAPWTTIVGVVADIKHRSLQREARPEMYIPHAQEPASSMAIVLRAARRPADLGAAARQAVWAVDRDMPVYQVMTMRQVIDDRTDGDRVSTQILGVVGVVALALAAVGIYGVIASALRSRHVRSASAWRWERGHGKSAGRSCARRWCWSGWVW